MSTPIEHLEVVVGDDGSVPPVPAAEVARLGARPGEHLRLVRPERPPERRGRKKVRGILVGKIHAEDLLTDEDFAAAKLERIEVAERKYGSLE